MVRGSVFLKNKTQAVRLSKTVRLPDGVTRVDIERNGRVWTITPFRQGWATWFEGEGVSADFMAERTQPAPEVRDA
jgi:antitoxin VapB